MFLLIRLIIHLVVELVKLLVHISILILELLKHVLVFLKHFFKTVFIVLGLSDDIALWIFNAFVFIFLLPKRSYLLIRNLFKKDFRK